MIDRENHFRQLFAENPSSSEIQDPHLLLLNVFQNTAQFDYAQEDAEEVRNKIQSIFTKKAFPNQTVLSSKSPNF